MPVSAILGAIGGAILSVALPKLLGTARDAIPQRLGFIRIAYVRTAATTVGGLAAAAGISLSISDHSHEELTYVGWYGIAALGFALAVALTLLIDKRATRQVRVGSSPRLAMPSKAIKFRHESRSPDRESSHEEILERGRDLADQFRRRSMEIGMSARPGEELTAALEEASALVHEWAREAGISAPLPSPAGVPTGAGLLIWAQFVESHGIGGHQQAGGELVCVDLLGFGARHSEATAKLHGLVLRGLTRSDEVPDLVGASEAPARVDVVLVDRDDRVVVRPLRQEAQGVVVHWMLYHAHPNGFRDRERVHRDDVCPAGRGQHCLSVETGLALDETHIHNGQGIPVLDVVVIQGTQSDRWWQAHRTSG